MKLLVTGGAGFIGSNFVQYWLGQHPADTVVVFDALTYAGNLENLQLVENNPNYTFVKGNIIDRASVFAAAKDVDIIVHFAAESHVDRSILDPTAFTKTNVLGTQVLLDAAREFDIRFHHVSTDEVFGTLGPTDTPFTETTPYAPRSPYAASKAASDHLVRSYFHTYGTKITISNCSNNYGPYHFPEKIIPLFISNLMEGKTVPVYGDGQQIRDWIHVSDHNRGVEAIILHGCIGETYCLGGNNQTTNLELTKKLIALLGKDETSITYVQDRPGHDRRYDIDCSKAKEELGWEPTITLDVGLAETVQWYKDHQDWVARCKSGEYQEYYEQQYTAGS
jgi:dTDP-glucose 4,6-dehydratase